MGGHSEEGDIAGALRIYKSLWDLLDRDYGMEPSPQTEELVANIKLGVFELPPADRGSHARNGVLAARAINGSGLQSVPAASPLSNAPVKRLLVLRPFAMHGIDECHGHLVQGFSHHLAA